jgi:hypothetical protein
MNKVERLGELNMKQPSFGFSAWEDYEVWESTCPDWNWTGPLALATLDPETDLISSLRCPTCNLKIALLENMATIDQIRLMAEKGSKKAISHLAK